MGQEEFQSLYRRSNSPGNSGGKRTCSPPGRRRRADATPPVVCVEWKWFLGGLWKDIIKWHHKNTMSGSNYVSHIPVSRNCGPGQAMRRAGGDLLDGHPLQSKHLLGPGDGRRRVTLATLSHSVVAPGVHLILWGEPHHNWIHFNCHRSSAIGSTSWQSVLPCDRARQWLSPHEISMILVMLRSSMNRGLRDVVSEEPHPKQEPQPQANTWKDKGTKLALWGVFGMCIHVLL